MTSKLRKRAFIREWREKAGLTQAALAERIDRTEATLSRIEAGKIAYTQDTLEAVAEVLDVKPFALLLPPNEVRQLQDMLERMGQLVKESPTTFSPRPS